MEGVMLPRNAPDTAKNLLKQLWEGQITQEEFQKENAYWALECGFNELIPHPEPSMPQSLREYFAIPDKERKKVDFKKYMDVNPEIPVYYSNKAMIHDKNKSNLKWLKELKTYIPSDDTVNQQKLDTRIQEFLLFGVEGGV
jgi:hypothetical protein